MSKLLGLEPFEAYDADGGIVSVPNTGVYTILTSLSLAAPFLLEFIRVTVYDAGALPVVTWRITQDGIPVFPWIAQRIGGQTLVVDVKIDAVFRPQHTIALLAAVPTTAVGAFEVVGRLIGTLHREIGKR